MNQKRTIHSFVKRQRQLRPSKQKILDETWPIYGLDTAHGKISAEKVFGHNIPITLEIGFGMGDILLNSAIKYPERGFIGIEVHQPGIITVLSQLKTKPLNNIRLYNEDAVIVLQHCIPDNTLEKVLIFFPDPWPKKRHHKRRLIQPEFLDLLQKKLKPQGILYIATDWEDYANHIIAVAKNNQKFTILETQKTLPLISDRISTKFEQRGKKQGHKIFDLLFAAK